VFVQLCVGLALGGVALGTALSRRVDELNTKPPQWMGILGTLGVMHSFSLGLLLEGINLKNLPFFIGAMSEVVRDDLGASQSLVALLLVIVVSMAPMLAPIGVVLIVPHRSAAILTALERWLLRWNRVVTVALLSVFGVVFIVKGIRGPG
jgi:threonine/homoserine/homoserine lactone efflux protein